MDTSLTPRLFLGLALAAAPGALPSCAEAEGPVSDAADPADAALAPADQPLADTAPDDDAAPDVDAPTPAPVPPAMAERGLEPVRTVVHLHSSLSHDGCDQTFEETGEIDWACVARMKTALCREGVGVAFVTDHPNYTTSVPFHDSVYLDEAAGDVPLETEDGLLYGNVVTCSGGGGGPDGRVRLVAGYESPHTMPVGLRGPLHDMGLYGRGFDDGKTDAELAEITAAVHAREGIMTLAHTEESDISAETIARHAVDAMELYNFHANFLELYGQDLLQFLEILDVFAGEPGPGAPTADLSGLVMMGQYPEAALRKFRKVAARRMITGFAGADVHENVILPALCVEGLCDGLAETLPNLVEQLATEGPLTLSDGERLDGYGRVFRWVENLALVEVGGDPLAGVEDAMRAGRWLVVFRLMGDAPGVDLVVERTDGTLGEMGTTVGVADGATLWARAPDLPTPTRTVAFQDANDAAVTATLVHTAHDGTETVLESWTEPGSWRSVALDAPGAVQLEVWLKPAHLRPLLGSATHLADTSYRWVETGVVRVE